MESRRNVCSQLQVFFLCQSVAFSMLSTPPTPPPCACRLLDVLRGKSVAAARTIFREAADVDPPPIVQLTQFEYPATVAATDRRLFAFSSASSSVRALQFMHVVLRSLDTSKFVRASPMPSPLKVLRAGDVCEFWGQDAPTLMLSSVPMPIVAYHSWLRSEVWLMNASAMHLHNKSVYPVNEHNDHQPRPVSPIHEISSDDDSDSSSSSSDSGTGSSSPASDAGTRGVWGVYDVASALKAPMSRLGHCVAVFDAALPSNVLPGGSTAPIQHWQRCMLELESHEPVHASTLRVSLPTTSPCAASL